MIASKVLQPDGALLIHVEGRFDSAIHKFITEAQKEHEGEFKKALFDFSEVTTIDSSGMGALLALKENTDLEIVVINASKDIVRTFTVTKLVELFEVRGQDD